MQEIAEFYYGQLTAGNGLTKTKSYLNWKRDNIVDSQILKENSAIYNLLVGNNQQMLYEQ